MFINNSHRLSKLCGTLDDAGTEINEVETGDQRQQFKNRLPRAVLFEKVTSEQGLEDRRDHQRAGVGAPESKPWDPLRVNQASRGFLLCKVRAQRAGSCVSFQGLVLS